MKTVNVNDVLKILHKYGQFIFATDEKRYTEMMDEIANLPSTVDTMLDKIRAEIEEHRNKTAYMDKYDLVGDCLDIIDKYRKGQTDADSD